MVSLKDLKEIHLKKMIKWRSSERINKVSYSDINLNIEDQKKNGLIPYKIIFHKSIMLFIIKTNTLGLVT